MKNFDTVFRGYDKNQVIKYIDELILSYENLLNKSKNTEETSRLLEEKLKYYKNIENALNRAIFTAENAGDQIKRAARTEAQSIVDEAKRNANRIINDALTRSSKIQESSDRLKRNVDIYKRRLKAVVESQLNAIDEIEEIDYKNYE